MESNTPNEAGRMTTVATRIPFWMDAKLRDLKRKTGVAQEKLLHLAIERFLEDVQAGRIQITPIVTASADMKT